MKHIFLDLQERIKQTVPEVKWVDQDLGQLEFYTDRPAVLFPCVLIDFDNIDFEDIGQNAQLCNCVVKLRVAFNVYHHSNSSTPVPQREKALEIFDVIKNLHYNLHGWSGETFGSLARIRQVAEPREDRLRVYEIRYSIAYEDYMDEDLTTIEQPSIDIQTTLS